MYQGHVNWPVHGGHWADPSYMTFNCYNMHLGTSARLMQIAI